MKDSIAKVSLRTFFAVISTILKLVVSPLWLVYFIVVALIPVLNLSHAWIYNNDPAYEEAVRSFKKDTKGALNFWKVRVM